MYRWAGKLVMYLACTRINLLTMAAFKEGNELRDRVEVAFFTVNFTESFKF